MCPFIALFAMSERLPGARCVKQRKTMKATEGDEVQRFRLLELP
jgi:hypothetical protein